MQKFNKSGVSRRAVIAAGAAGAAALSMPSILSANERSLKVGVYGGYFKKSFDNHIFPEFTKATGIKVESVAEPTGEAWLVQLEQAARAKRAPADVSMMSQVALLKGQATKLWAPLDMGKMPNASNLLSNFINKYPDGETAGIGAVSWYVNLVSNTEIIKEAPTSWAAMWDPARKDQLGLLALVSNSFLLEVTATTFFGGTQILDTEEGILKVMDKLAELKGNVRLWYRDEAQFEQGLKTGEIQWVNITMTSRVLLLPMVIRFGLLSRKRVAFWIAEAGLSLVHPKSWMKHMSLLTTCVSQPFSPTCLAKSVPRQL